MGDEKDFTKTEYQLDQGDKISGQISRCTLGLLVRDLVQEKGVANRITFECAGS